MQHEISSSMMICTVDDLVEAHGGTGKFAEFLDVSPQCVSNYKAAGEIPRGYHLVLYLDAQERGWTVAPQLFGLKRWPSPPKGSRRRANGHSHRLRA
jgi:hypothetical protein